MARPQIEIDWKKVDDLLISGSPGTEVADFLGIHPETLYRKVEETFNVGFTEYSTQKKSKGQALIRARQFKKALDGDNTLLIWLGKIRLGQRDGDEKHSSPNDGLLDTLKGLAEENSKLKEIINGLESKTTSELPASQ